MGRDDSRVHSVSSKKVNKSRMKETDSNPLSLGLILANGFTFFGSVNFGFALAWTAASLQNINNDSSMPNLSQNQQNWVSAMITVGAIVGTILGPLLSERFSKYRVLVLTIFPASAGWASVLLSEGVSALIVGRTLVGISLGFVNTTAPAFIAEITPPRCRGLMGGMYQVGIYVGVFVCLMMSPYAHWRSLTFVGLLIGCTMSSGLVFMKKTCEHLIRQNTSQNTEIILRSVSHTFNENKKTICGKSDDTSLEGESNAKLWNSLKKPEVYKPFILCNVMSLGFQFSAVNVIVFYNIKMFTNTGMSYNTAYLGSQCLGVAQLALGILGSFLALRLPRRPFYFLTALFVTLGLASVGFSYFVDKKQGSSTVTSVAVICSFVFTQSTFALGYGTITWAYIGELLPRDLAGLTIGSASFINWVASFFLTFFHHLLIDCLGDDRVFFCYASLFFITNCFLIPWLPETRGKSLAEIQAEFQPTTESKYSENTRLIADQKRSTTENGYQIITGRN